MCITNSIQQNMNIYATIVAQPTILLFRKTITPFALHVNNKIRFPFNHRWYSTYVDVKRISYPESIRKIAESIIAARGEQRSFVQKLSQATQKER